MKPEPGSDLRILIFKKHGGQRGKHQRQDGACVGALVRSVSQTACGVFGSVL